MSKYYLLVIGLVFAVFGGLATRVGFALAFFMQIAGCVFIAMFAGLFMFTQEKK